MSFRSAMLLAVAAAALLCALAGPARAQEPSSQDLKQMYDDALAQLKAAQDRRSELAAENEKLVAERGALAARVADLEGQLTTARAELSEVAEKTYVLRAHYAAWKQFLATRPALKARWDALLSTSLLKAHGAWPTSDGMLDEEWPAATAQGSVEPTAP